MSTHLDRYTALVLCAGLGTRLRPLTQYVPKTAAPVGQWPVAFTTIKRLLDAGCTQVHCNTHYLAPFVEAELLLAAKECGYGPERLRFWREETLLETGGGIARIVQALTQEDSKQAQKDVLVFSGDIYSDLPLEELLEAWESRPAKTTTMMSTRALPAPRKDVAWVNMKDNQVIGFGPDISAPTENLESRLFTNHQIIAHEVIARANVVKDSSINLFYRDALRRGEHILNFTWSTELMWQDIGTYAAYDQCLRQIAQANPSAYPVPKHCLILALLNNDGIQQGVEVTDQKKSGEDSVLTSYHLALCPIPWPVLQLPVVNRLRTAPCLPSSVTFTEKLNQILNRCAYSNSSTLPLVTGETSSFASPFACVTLPSLAYSLPLPELTSTSQLNSSALSSQPPLPLFPSHPSLPSASLNSGFLGSLPCPILVPLELLESLDPSSLFASGANPYSTSQTFFVFL